MDHTRQGPPSEPSLAADADRAPGPPRSGAFHGATRAGLRRVEPLTSAELIRAGVRPQLLVLLALRRASGGGVATSGGHYLDHGRPMPSYLTGAFEELADTELLALAEEDPWGMRRVSLTPSGHARHVQLSATSGRVALQRGRWGDG
ncbi:MAG: hypothetical protein ACRDRQ_21250 [Pseudonocardiaceae bacterium]